MLYLVQINKNKINKNYKRKFIQEKALRTLNILNYILKPKMMLQQITVLGPMLILFEQNSKK